MKTIGVLVVCLAAAFAWPVANGVQFLISATYGKPPSYKFMHSMGYEPPAPAATPVVVASAR
ncbi:MAG: hypothetical protein JST54_10695 [Deltaproteobacteria bacterium]|nr:hypothetical protein [Deltaproteobacteria bacterium]